MSAQSVVPLLFEHGAGDLVHLCVLSPFGCIQKTSTFSPGGCQKTSNNFFSREKKKLMLSYKHYNPKMRLHQKWRRNLPLPLYCDEIVLVIILLVFFCQVLINHFTLRQPIRAQEQYSLPLLYHFPEILYIRMQKSDFPLHAVWTETWTPHPRLFENAPII